MGSMTFDAQGTPITHISLEKASSAMDNTSGMLSILGEQERPH